MMIEKEYVSKVTLEHRKRFAQFFTPELIAEFMAKWVLGGEKARLNILEPAFGLGIFSKALYKLNKQINVVGYDIDKTILSFAKSNLGDLKYKVHIKNEDYLTATWSDKYDGIICNPPYLKFHDYDNSSLIPIVNNKLKINLNGFTNLYTLFLLKSINQMNERGRMAYIVPSEFLNSDYGVEVKRTLLKSNVLRHVIIVDFKQSAFADAITTACILLCSKDNNSSEINFSKIENVTELSSAMSNFITYKKHQVKADLKWKQYYDETVLSKYRDLVPFSTFAKVSRGIATGDNSYFTFNLSKIDSYNIPIKYFIRCICHSIDVKGQVFTNEDFELVANKDKKVYLFNGCVDETEPHAESYLRLGEQNGVDKKYLTSKRKPWYTLEKRKPSPLWVSVFNRNGLRFVRNLAGVYNLTTFHCVYNISKIDTDVLFAYLITDVAKEIFLDNSRQYGNGLIKFEPNDLNKGKVVDLRLLTKDEKNFLRSAAEKLQHYRSSSSFIIDVLDEFFKDKYTGCAKDIAFYDKKLGEKIVPKFSKGSITLRNYHFKQLNFLDLFEQFSDDPIVENVLVHEDPKDYERREDDPLYIDKTKNCLISLVKKDNFEHFLDQSAKLYYTGKKFPSTVALNKLFYFMPYLKGKGIRDLYYIKVARIGTRKEGQPKNNPEDLRLVFEIEYIGQLFDEYRQIELKIWHTFTDTTIRELLND